MNKQESVLVSQIIPIGLTAVIAAALAGFLWLEVVVLNRVTGANIVIHLRWYDVLIGMTIYLKTSIDFAIVIARLMGSYPGWKNRIAIEIGTAVGNAGGTFAILILWALFKEVRWLLALMIFVAALVLFRLAQDGLEHAKTEDGRYPRIFKSSVNGFDRILKTINRFIAPVLKYIVPELHIREKANATFWMLFGFSFTIPFILGLDDFAGYVPLFNIVNVFGFAIGVLAGHMLLNMFLFISPRHTIAIVKNPIISFVGSIAFVALGIWGLVEVAHLIGY